ncbi:hypothetical protein BDU57DRAFT_528761 [Ampelomyces quisqualis]|uniref:Uncharacterized protein n=1 Tax=Ampelomyces quisqualis TaxID=50730 RepID=A0A6A5QSH0_AMPQU|nr:hypothetical protein BDU57DRAFT_528761 [Ampelomyces quisqualis]
MASYANKGFNNKPRLHNLPEGWVHASPSYVQWKPSPGKEIPYWDFVAWMKQSEYPHVLPNWHPLFAAQQQQQQQQQFAAMQQDQFGLGEPMAYPGMMNAPGASMPFPAVSPMMGMAAAPAAMQQSQTGLGGQSAHPRMMNAPRAPMSVPAAFVPPLVMDTAPPRPLPTTTATPPPRVPAPQAYTHPSPAGPAGPPPLPSSREAIDPTPSPPALWSSASSFGSTAAAAATATPSSSLEMTDFLASLDSGMGSEALDTPLFPALYQDDAPAPNASASASDDLLARAFKPTAVNEFLQYVGTDGDDDFF